MEIQIVIFLLQYPLKEKVKCCQKFLFKKKFFLAPHSDGLITPIIKNAQKLNVSAIQQQTTVSTKKKKISKKIQTQ